MLIERPIIEETQSYFLLAPDYKGDPGYLTLQPKGVGIKKVWMAKVRRYLELFAEPTNITYNNPAFQNTVFQPDQWFSYNIKGGTVRYNSALQEVVIQEMHPNKKDVIRDLLSLFWTTRFLTQGNHNAYMS